MGYYTEFTLEIKEIRNGMKFEDVKDKTIQELERLDVLNYAISKHLEPCDSVKWYSFGTDMKELSSNIPDVLFKLHGEGEENGDIWDAYFMNGKMQKCDAQFTIPPFDESKLN